MLFFVPQLLILLGLPLLFLGIWRLKQGWRPARVGDDPYCRACEYSLVGLESNRCPECGAALTDNNIVHGRRSRNPPAFWLGLFLILLGIAAFLPFCTDAFSDIQWIRLKPTSWLLSDLKGSFNPPAWNELKRRGTDGSLNDSQIQAIIDQALPQQIATPASPIAGELVTFAADQLLAGKMTEPQKQRFYTQIFSCSLQTRPQISLGSFVSYRLNERSGCPTTPWWIEDSIRAVKIDGKIIEDRYKNPGGGGRQSGLSSGGSMGSSVKCSTVGKHELTIVVRIALSKGPFGLPNQSQLVYQEDRDVSTTFEMVAMPGAIELIDDPKLAPQMRAGITPQSFEYDSAHHVIRGEFQITSVPCDVAFDVIGRWDGKEHLIYSLNCNASNTNQNATYSLTGSVDTPPPPSIDLILRTSEKAARDTVDQTQIWKGELIYRNLPVKIIAK
jgi:hypothetical protein